MAKRFMFVCFGLLALALAYHLGASSAQSQVGEFVSIADSNSPNSYGQFYILAANGDVYQYRGSGWPGLWYYVGNPTGTATQPSTWGQIKAQFKD